MIKKQSKFDWQLLVKENKPGKESPTQLLRSDLFARLLTDVDSWATRYKFPQDRIKACAYTGVFSTLNPLDYEQALVMAKYTLWLFMLDNYIDSFQPGVSISYRPDFTQTQDELKLLLQSALKVLGQPVYEPQLETSWETSPDRVTARLASVNSAMKVEADNKPELLLAALLDLYQHLEILASRQSQPQPFHLNNFCAQTACVLEAMRWELRQSWRYHTTKTLPDFEEYLTQAKYSICLSAAGSLALAASTQPVVADPVALWELSQPAMEAGARAIRLANDLANVQRELAEQKINAVTIALAESGFAPMVAYQDNSPELLQAKDIVHNRMSRELDNFSRFVVALPDEEGALTYCIKTCVAFTLAMYQAGDYKPV